VPLDRYIRTMYRAGARRVFDSLAINSYAKNHRELRRLLASIGRLMNRRGDRRGGIWITEIGWGDVGPKHRFIVGARQQARRITKALALISKKRRRLRLRGVVYYSWRDSPPYPPRYSDLWALHTGLLGINGGFKPAFYAFKSGVARLRYALTGESSRDGVAEPRLARLRGGQPQGDPAYASGRSGRRMLDPGNPSRRLSRCALRPD
jgi:hypothetical protein